MTIQHIPGHFEPYPKFRVPFYKPLAEEETYSWVDDYLVEMGLRQRIQYLRGQKGEFKKMAPQVSDLRLTLEASWEKYLTRAAKRFVAFYLNQASPDPFSRLERKAAFVQVIPFEFIDRVIAVIESDATSGPDDDRISEKDRLDELKAIENSITEARGELAELTDRNKSYFLMDRARVNQDARHELVKHWRSIQAWVRNPCNPQGVDLNLSFPEEIAAHEKLDISSAILPKANKLAYPKAVP